MKVAVKGMWNAKFDKCRFRHGITVSITSVSIISDLLSPKECPLL